MVSKTSKSYVALQTPRARSSSTGGDLLVDDPWKRDLRNPLDTANWLSQLTLWWVNPAIRRGSTKLLEEDDVWELPVADKSETLQRVFDTYYDEDMKLHKLSSRSDPTKPAQIYRAMWNATRGKMGLAIGLHLVSAIATLLQPLLIKAVLQYLTTDGSGGDNIFGISSGYVLAGLLTAAAVVGVTALDYGMYLCTRAGINARMIVVNGVYQKVLKLTSTARMAMNSGDIITLAGVDSERLYEAYAIGLWSLISPLMILSVCILVAIEMGALVGLVAALCCALILLYAVTNSRQIGKMRRAILQVAGERVKVTNEVLQGIRVIKMYAWEPSICERVAEIREREIVLIRKYDYLRVHNMVVLTLAQMFMTAACLLVYVYQGNTLDVPTAFALLALANACRMPFGIFSNAVVFTSEALASMDRIAKFLASDEIKPVVLGNGDSHVPLVEGQPIIEIDDADFSWVPPTAGTNDAVPVARPILRNINFSVAPGSLTVIVGAVGSGKSSLVSALLGEMEKLRGTRAVRGTIAYASQEAWIQHNTVRENILFGLPYDAEHYHRVIEACQLTRDLEILDHGDATEIGERGINLSGGQKARVSLARVMYRRKADLVVLDDPLSALDVHVANAVFFECVQGLVASKTRLLVLNAHYHLLRHADRVVLLSDGEIVGDGTYEDVKAKFAFLEDQAHEKVKMAGEHDTESSLDTELEIHDENQQREILHDALSYPDVQDALTYAETPEVMERMSASTVGSRLSRRSKRIQSSSTRHPDEKDGAKQETIDKTATMMTEEDRAAGSVTWRTYAAFLECCGYSGTWLLVLLFVLFALGQGGMLGADYFMTYWANGSIVRFSQETLVWMYVAIVALATLLGIIRAVVFTEVCIRASKMLHTKYFTKVVLAPINTFFDVTPVGRVLNRFSRDLDQIDNPLPYYALGLLIFFMLTLSIFLVCAVTTPTTLILYVPLLYACYKTQTYFLATSRELKRLDGITRSPFLNLVAETINGIESIRSFGMTSHFSHKCHELLDYNSKFYFMFQTSSKWFAMRLDWLVTSVVVVVSFTCVASRDSIGSASAGIALTYAVQLTMQFQRLLTLASMTENYMTSYERIAHYGTLDQEGDTKQVTATAATVTAKWPVNATIEFSNVFLRYRDGLDFVLRGVSFSVRDGEKVGVCGRTGSGKSTLMNALFRTVESADGVIRIDGVDIATVTLQQLRSRLTIIPQDPVLFSGTLRDNLDPFSEKSDDQLFSALRKVHLIDDVSRWGKGLSYEVAEKGENLSVGQRQLLCIARALLRESKIIVLDEATANVDQELDRLIQVAVKECFRGRTALTIAHRLETIVDSDRILVMDQGRVAEFDSPANLLATENGIFASLMQSTTTTKVE